ncbi:MAG: alanine:cation symporter family protein [Bacteroidota bacterium]|nr:alanine:cation symporter family protein [Bacteroidota bacterium]
MNAQVSTDEPAGLDERINNWFQPIADWFESVVFYSIPISDKVSVPIVVMLLVFGALFFTIYFSFINIRKFGLAIRVVRGKYDFLDKEREAIDTGTVNIVDGDIARTIRDESHSGEVNHFQALSAAVSGTVGLGNIAGVAIAIAIGGPGATFWMIVCGLIGMSTKFVECTLGVKYRDIDSKGVVYGGPMYYLKKGFADINATGFGKFMAVFFAILCVGASFGGGNAFQSNQAAAQIAGVIGASGGASGFWIGIVLMVVVGIVIVGGIKRIATVTEKIVPFMAILYILASLFIIFYNYDFIDDALKMIFVEAFNPQATVGGMIGVIIVGFRRAAFSNEAGAGSAAIAHSAVRTRYPASEGIVSLLEPFIDTVVICTMTALVIIMFNRDGAFVYGGDAAGTVILKATGQGVGGVDLTTLAYDTVIPHFSIILTLAIVLFAISTMISWSYYGLQAWKYLFGRGKAADLMYKILFLAFIVIGASATLDAVIRFSDAMILAMVFPNMIGLLFLFPKVREELSIYLAAINKSRG